MSRVGKAPISVPAGVEVSFKDGLVSVKGKLGELQQKISDDVEFSLEDGTITLSRTSEAKQTVANHGLYRALINNMIIGVAEGFEKKLELVGVGYRASNQGQRLDLSLGYSHNIVIELPKEIKLETVSDKGKNPIVILKSHDKQLVGMVASKIRSFRKPEPYKGKGVRFVGEYIRRKAGKTASK
ncbi:MAG: 50S ribosomal protein L6 [Croceimicrobium sp.]|nr:50S ribosomal protein L6 [Bacteroidota bacterium]